MELLKIKFEVRVPKGYIDSGHGVACVYCTNLNLTFQERIDLARHHCLMATDARFVKYVSTDLVNIKPSFHCSIYTKYLWYEDSESPEINWKYRGDLWN